MLVSLVNVKVGADTVPAAPSNAVPSPSVVLASAAWASFIRLRPKAVQGISSTTPAPAVDRPSKRSVADTFCTFAYVTAPFAILAVVTLPSAGVATSVETPPAVVW